MGLSLESLGSSRRGWLGLAAFTVALRLGFAMMIPVLAGALQSGEGKLFSSLLATDDYEKIARNLLAGHGYRIKPELGETMLRNPGYVMILAGAFTVFGDARIVGQVIQALISGGVVLLIGKAGRPVIGPRGAFAAGVLYALYPPDWLASARYAAEPMLMLFLLLWVLAVQNWLKRGGYGWALAIGVLSGLMALTKSVVVYLLPFALVWLVLFYPSFRQRLKAFAGPAVVTLAMQLLVLMPWGAFNYARSGHWVFSSSIVGWTLYDTQYVNQNRHRDVAPRVLWLEARAQALELARQEGLRADPRDEWAFNFFDVKDEYAMGQLLKERAIESMLAHPAQTAAGVLHNATEFWYVSGSRGFTLVGLAMNVPLLLLGIAGTIRGRAWRSESGRLWIGIIIYMNLVTALSFAVARYAIPVMPFVFLLAGAGLSRRAQGKVGAEPAGSCDAVVPNRERMLSDVNADRSC